MVVCNHEQASLAAVSNLTPLPSKGCGATAAARGQLSKEPPPKPLAKLPHLYRFSVEWHMQLMQ